MSQLTDDEIRQVMPHLERFAVWLTRNPHSAEDLVQNCLAKALTRERQNDGEQSLRAWLFSILYRQFIDGERRRKRYMKLLTFFTGEEMFAQSSEAMAIADDTLAVFAALPTDYRVVLLLVSVEGLSYKEAAETLDIPLGTVMSRLSRGRKLLHEQLEGKATPLPLRRLK
ncbi:RNA polymerase sigma factor [Pantoea cypripedii]|uniref:RNA polymerase subunit sigma-24 n=1 Tax=Pantoea cypripedii TaxID=55209 RepID=A0A1X1EM27_PANCY|nr:RNA polymerase sigma factor [Pantoea cypripedii]MBP2199175.1 RNA polymerase sigma-70 factor (ECF subfamily) [Pantoea cypripedii]ORM89997.1 RNA polymerase subunit sigma-24 [Pantoea cypripedii]